jgi:hypothetical protein
MTLDYAKHYKRHSFAENCGINNKKVTLAVMSFDHNREDLAMQLKTTHQEQYAQSRRFQETANLQCLQPIIELAMQGARSLHFFRFQCASKSFQSL